MHQIRCSLCGRQTLVDPQNPGTCPSCGFPLSMPAEAEASVPAADALAAGAPAEVVEPVVPVEASEPAAASADVAPLTLGPFVDAPASLMAATHSEVPAAAGSALVLGPVVSDPAPVEMSQTVQAVQAEPQVDEAPAPEPAAVELVESPSLDAAPTATEASAAEPQVTPVEAAYVPPEPAMHTSWQDASDAAEAGSDTPMSALEDIYAAPAAEPAPAQPEAATPDVAMSDAQAPALEVRPPSFDASDAAIVTATEPGAVVEDIYVTQMAEPAAEPAPMPVLADADALASPAPMAAPMAADERAEPSASAAAETAEPVVGAVAEEPPAAMLPVPEPVAPLTTAPATLAAEQHSSPAAASAPEVPVQPHQPADAVTMPVEPVAPVEPPPAAGVVPPAPASEPAAAGSAAQAPFVPPVPYPYPPQPQPPTTPYVHGAQQPPAPPYPYPVPAGTGMPMGQMPPMAPVGQMPPPKKSRTGLIVGGIIAGVLVLALIIAVFAALAFVLPARSGSNGPVPVTPTAAPVTPTSSIPSGFLQYTDSAGTFSLYVPSDWTQNTPSNTTGKIVDFTAPDHTGRMRVAVISGTIGSEGQAFDDGLLQAVVSGGKLSNKQGPTTVTQAGETWTQESADVTDSSGTLHVVADVTTHGSNTFAVLYLGVSDSFSTLDSQDFQPMFTSFQFQ